VHWIWKAMIAVGLTAVCYGTVVVSGTDPANLPARVYDHLAKALCCSEGPVHSAYSPTRHYCRGAGLPPRTSGGSRNHRDPCVTCRRGYARAIVYEVPLGLITLSAYGLLTRLFDRRHVPMGESLCRRCGHILRGITEPRCPECGERI
jgi:hypothetical protein